MNHHRRPVDAVLAAALAVTLLATVLGSFAVPPATAAAAVAPDVTNWHYARRISASAVGPTVIELDGPVLASARSDLGDLRILDATKQEIPWREVVPPSSRETRHRVRIIDLVTDASRSTTSFVADLGRAGQVTNRLVLTTSSQDFFKRVTFSVSSDLVSWRSLTGSGSVGYVYDLSSSGGGRHLTVDYPETSHRYLRIEIADLGTPPLRDLAAELTRLAPVAAAEETLQSQLLTQDTMNDDSRTVIDLYYPGIATSAIVLTTSVASFRRPVLIEGSNDRLRWVEVANDVISRTPEGERLRLPLPDGSCWRFYRVTVHGLDSPLLAPESVSARAVPRRVVFLRPSADQLFLLYGNPTASLPTYDLTPLQAITPEKAAAATLGRELSVMTEPETVAPTVPPKTDADPRFWRYERSVAPSATGFVAVTLDAAVRDGAKADLTDLRLLDETDAAIPYIIRRGASAAQPFTIVNRGDSTDVRWWTLDLGARNASSHLLRFSSIGTNFEGSTTIRGSNDGENWEMICCSAGVRVAETIFGREENLTVTYPEALYRYLAVNTGVAGQLQPTEVCGFPCELVFVAEAGHQYRLRYGNPEAVTIAPHPELFLGAEGAVAVGPEALGKPLDRQPAPRRPWFLRGGDASGIANPANRLLTYGLWALLAALVVGLMVVIVRIFRRVARNLRE